MRLSIPDGVLIGSAVFAQLKLEGPCTLQCAAPFLSHILVVSNILAIVTRQ